VCAPLEQQEEQHTGCALTTPHVTLQEKRLSLFKLLSLDVLCVSSDTSGQRQCAVEASRCRLLSTLLHAKTVMPRLAAGS